ncbi:dephospho-CoA kinase [Companilactobacillus jidongensis]|uniref:dephospho-CoA kinase n=1 Tax=Companilactobacillus jidongensis TaxID=2486006 RepID=UPI000F79954A|nr:dephospho-CoA kinase [Companilactobacillus jidongensis]
MSKVYGLTGGIAAGKSTVLDLFRQDGCVVYDADQVARDVVKRGTVGLEKIVNEFGKDILLSDGELNRTKLGSIVFGDKDQLKNLTNITAPLIRKQILHTIEQARKSNDKEIVIFEIQLLFEANYQSYFDGIISIYVPEKVQLERLIERDRISEEDAMNKINAQMPIEQKKNLADFVIDNSGNINILKTEIYNLTKKL